MNSGPTRDQPASREQRLVPPQHPLFGDINCEIAVGDEMWDTSAHYIGVGLSAIEIVDCAILRCSREAASIRSILGPTMRAWPCDAFLATAFPGCPPHSF